jgi:hypothetical protein
MRACKRTSSALWASRGTSMQRRDDLSVPTGTRSPLFAARRLSAQHDARRCRVQCGILTREHAR